MIEEATALAGKAMERDTLTQVKALQVRQPRDRFKNAAPAGADSAGERLLAWCAEPGVADAADRQRCERVFANVGNKT